MGVEKIDRFAFNRCSNLTSIIIHNSKALFCKRAFYGCRNLSSIDISGNINLNCFEEGVLGGCEKLLSLKIDNNLYYDSRDNCNAIIETNSNSLYWGCASTIIPHSVTSISRYAFRGNILLKSIVIPGSVVRIKVGAFAGCSKLSSVKFEEGITEIEDSAFFGCKMKSITIPEGLKKIENNAFAWCSNLAEVYLPDSVEEIGEHVFFECRKLKSIYIPKGSLNKFKSLFIPWYHIYLKELSA